MSKINGIGIGVSYGNSSGSGSLIDSSTFFAPLKTSLILTRGTGDPTWSRATKAWGFNELGYLEELASGCAFFGGARLVRNLVPTPSTTLAVSGTKTVTLTQAATLQFSMGAGAGTATFSGTGGATGTLAAGASRVSVNKTVTAGTFIVTASVDALVDLSIVDVTNYDASYIPEYVSVGVVASPFFGAGIDGAKYFETDWQGAPIAAANLLKLRREASAINNLLQCRNLTQNAWGAPANGGVGSEVLTNGTFADSTGWTPEAAAYWSISGGLANLNAPDGTAAYLSNTQTYGSLVTGKQYVIEFDYTHTSGNAPIPTLRGSDAKAIGNSTGRKTITITCGASVAGYGLRFQSFGACVATIDNITIKEAPVQCAQTATGLDGIANTASTLTFTAADAIILQSISLASAARCASAYVKRRTGTGTISFTQDGGSTWTDITSQINSSTWSRVEITSTLANPSVGFKGGTLGDEIDVDCVQNEAGAVATSPIVTTTSTVSRNGDSLTYQTASNWSDTAGTAYIEVQPLSWVAGGAIGSATNGLLLSAANSGATASDGTNTANGPAGSPSGREKLAMRWGGGAMTVASGGVVGTAGTYDGGMGIASVGIAVNSSTYCGPVAIYNYQMTDAELQALTT